jgi:2-polyprenyl-3-methyl-5-hydroxy-6-metoxy-1,4-benzoquinol methylase
VGDPSRVRADEPAGRPPDRPRGYRDRIYGQYVSAFKGRPAPEKLVPALRRQARFFDHLLAPVLAGGRPRDGLEVGCGPGHFLFWARERGFPSVQGFDLSAEQIEAARALGLDAEVAGYREFFPRCGKTFDLIVALDVIEHLTRDEVFEFLDLCWAALRPGGMLFLTTPNGAALRPGPVSYGDLTHETIFSPQTMELVLRLTGFGRPEIREISPPLTSLRSAVRAALWQLIRLGPLFVDLVEKGSCSVRVCSRVMSVLARKPPAEPGNGIAP